MFPPGSALLPRQQGLLRGLMIVPWCHTLVHAVVFLLLIKVLTLLFAGVNGDLLDETNN